MPSFIDILEFLGTFAFAISGIRLASGKQIDWFGAYIIGLITAIGGGTLRDLLLDVTPFWMTNSMYFSTTALALFATLLFKEKIFKLGEALFLFDAIGLGLFTVVGITKSVDAGLPIWVSITMGTITGTVGGVLRDVLINEVPALFKRDIYALACIAGGVVYFAGQHIGLPSAATEISAAAAVIVLRLLAVRYHLHIPVLKNNYTGEDKPTTNT